MDCRCDAVTVALTHSTAFRRAHFGLILALCHNNRRLPFRQGAGFGMCCIVGFILLEFSCACLPYSLNLQRVFFESCYWGKTRKRGNCNMTEQLRHFLRLLGVQYVRTFASGERARESRLALITFAYPTYIMGSQGSRKVEKLIHQTQYHHFSTKQQKIAMIRRIIQVASTWCPVSSPASALISFLPSLAPPPHSHTRLASFASAPSIPPPPLYL